MALEWVMRAIINPPTCHPATLPPPVVQEPSRLARQSDSLVGKTTRGGVGGGVPPCTMG